MASLVSLCVKALARLYMTDLDSLQSLADLPLELASQVLSYFPPVMLLRVEKELAIGPLSSTALISTRKEEERKEEEEEDDGAPPAKRRKCIKFGVNGGVSSPGSVLFQQLPSSSGGHAEGVRYGAAYLENGVDKNNNRCRRPEIADDDGNIMLSSMPARGEKFETICFRSVDESILRDTMKMNEDDTGSKDMDLSYGYGGHLSSENTSASHVDGLKALLSVTWKELVERRWPTMSASDEEQSKGLDPRIELRAGLQPFEEELDWKETYLGNHLQACLTAAANTFTFGGNASLGDICIEDNLQRDFSAACEILCIDDQNRKEGFEPGQYRTLRACCELCAPFTRSLRLHGPFCTDELADLLAATSLKVLIVYNLRPRSKFSGICRLMKRNASSLLRLRFLHCTFTAVGLQDLLGAPSAGRRDGTHGLKWLEIVSSGLEPYCCDAAGLAPNCCDATITAARAVGSFIQKARSLELVELWDNRMNNEHFGTYAYTLLQSVPTFKVLSFCDNRLGSAFAEKLSVMKRSTLHIRHLDLSRNHFTEPDVINLVKCLKNMRALQLLDLSGNPLDDSGIRALVPFIEVLKSSESSLLELNVSDCDFSLDGGEALLAALAVPLHPVKRLSISGNFLGSKISQSLSAYINKSSVEKLDIHDVGLDSTGCSVSLEATLLQSRTLTSLNISNNRIGKPGAAMIASVIRQGQGKLTRIDASGNLFGAQAIQDIASALQYRMLHKLGIPAWIDLRHVTFELPENIQSIFDEARRNQACTILFADKMATDFFVDDEV